MRQKAAYASSREEGYLFLETPREKECLVSGARSRNQKPAGLSLGLSLPVLYSPLPQSTQQADGPPLAQRPLIAFGATCKDRFDPLHPGCKQAGEYLVGPAWVRRSLSDPVISEPGREKGRGWGSVSQKRDCFQERRILVASQWGQTPQLSVQRNPEPGWGFLEDTERAQQLKGLRHLRPVPDHKT